MSASNLLGLSDAASPSFPAKSYGKYDSSAQLQPLVKVEEIPSIHNVVPSSRPFLVAKTGPPAWQQAHSPTSSLPPSLHLVSPNLLPHSTIQDSRADRSPRFLNLQVSDLRQCDDDDDDQHETSHEPSPEPQDTPAVPEKPVQMQVEHSDSDKSDSEVAVKALQALQESFVHQPRGDVAKLVSEDVQRIKQESDVDSGYANNLSSNKSSKSSTPSLSNAANDVSTKTPPRLSPFDKYDEMSDTEDELSADEFDLPEGKLRGKLRRDSSALQELPAGPVTEGDPKIRPYACNYPDCIEKDDKFKARLEGTPQTGSSRDLEEDIEPTSFSTIRELRNHNTQFHKEANSDFVLPYRCALDCDKTFKSLAGLRWHFNNAASSGHLFVSMEPGEERPTKKFKTMSQRAERKERCPVRGCSKGFKQHAGLAYHLAHAPKHHVSEELFRSLDQRLASKYLWWLRKLNRPLPGYDTSDRSGARRDDDLEEEPEQEESDGQEA